MTRRLRFRLFMAFILVAAFVGPACSPADSVSSGHPVEFTYRIVNKYPHDPAAFTQGLVLNGGFLYESTGRRGQSSLRKVETTSGRVLKILTLADNLFGEGITVWEDRIIQLTWESGTGLVYDKNTFRLIKEFYYPGEGWGLTHDGERLFMSDGTAFLRELDPDTFEEVNRFEVTDQDVPVSDLNELEYIDGRIWANIWTQERIVMIDPKTGRVTGRLDLTGLANHLKLENPADVLNGIAYDAATGGIYVTGKLWPSLFEIEVIPK